MDLTKHTFWFSLLNDVVPPPSPILDLVGLGLVLCMFSHASIYHHEMMFYVRRETEGEDYNEREIDEAMSSEQIPDQENSDHSDAEKNTVFEEYDLDNYDEDGEGERIPSLNFSLMLTNIYTRS